MEHEAKKKAKEETKEVKAPEIADHSSSVEQAKTQIESTEAQIERKKVADEILQTAL